MCVWKNEYWLPGVLSINQIQKLQDEGFIQGFTIPQKGKFESAIDLYLSNEGYEMIQGTIKPMKYKSYKSFLEQRKYSIPLKQNKDRCYELHLGHCYVFKLKEKFTRKIKKSNVFYGQATAKSSIGRLDVIARLIVDGEYKYDYMSPDNVKGEMYLEILPISYNIIVKEGITLSQLRLFYGKTEDSEIKDESFISSIISSFEVGQVGYLSVNTKNLRIGGLEVCSYCARKNENNEEFIDITKKNYQPYKFWSFKKSNDENRLTIEKEDFYILRSKELISLPPGVAIYCRAIDESLGEMRIHYAGFVHPCFGYKRKDGEKGTPLMFEVRGHDVNVTLADGETLAKLIFYRMSEKAEGKSPYDKQNLMLSKYFEKWPKMLEYENEEEGIVKPKNK
ncbi:MAG: hypothetical protein A2X61_07570 [Ignavibacteria bacterium GWB2_35_12]|nr:MAG: hypothetical protein A2X63_12870 [Ignavibacteria bacterium GWA2_35_8]OGU39185.1 MAG: hypothetical protein A2X61_07570 [Ignavibacteria bacterium GWB2_35_12]OGU89213.1 MAG: hypothetical protein A2220_00960 [Ignavibacteria bacterium RIFOXYA2_FULL_35_10]OGV21051.1 MAG: hypothetical protein A2475_00860 [Ignavibacteria bacterium RIFOXYC2_FULL_35_21]